MDAKSITIGSTVYYLKDASAVHSTNVTTIVSLSQADYEALSTKDSSTLYIIVES